MTSADASAAALEHGLSDVVPIKGHARSVAMIEQVCGLFYIAMVVTRLVGLKTLRVKSRQ
ncbi:MAG: hypothetical protein ACR2HA_00830 [Nocardioides sp.]